MTKLPHQRFPVYLDSLELYREVVAILAALPKGHSDLADQIRRASQSVSLNIAEGAGRFTRLDKRRFYLTAQGSAAECSSVIDLWKIQGLVTEADAARVQSLIVKIANGLEAMTKSMS